MKLVFNLGLAAALLIPATASADRRAFGFTYEYPTQPEGAIELELWNTQIRDGLNEDGGASSAEQQLEIEYGITDRTSISLYQVVAEPPGEGLHYAETKVELRHRLAERGEWPIDITLYGEVAKPFGVAEVELEPKLILARDFGAFTVAANGIAEIGIERAKNAAGEKKLETDFVPGWAAGITYELMPQLKLGGETWGEAPKVADKRQTFAWAGPAVSWAPSTRLWITGSAGFGLTDRSDDLVARFVISVGL